MLLTSAQNPLLQAVRRAVQDGRPLENGLLAAEGAHLLAEALESPWHVGQIFYSTDSADQHHSLLAAAARKGIEQTEVSVKAFKSISDTAHNQGILSLIRPQTFTWPDLFHSPGPLVIVDGIQDPGNAGAIIRSTEAFGGSGILFTEGCVRVSNGKLLRASAGSVFRVPYMEDLTRTEIISQLRSRGQNIFSLVVGGRNSIFAPSLATPFSLVIGSEGAGVSSSLLNASTTLSIPTAGVESLNAAIACSITLFEAARQRAKI